MQQRDPGATVDTMFTYDRLNQLTGESAEANQFTYDSLGNCLSKNGQTRQIDALNRLANDGDSAYTYDANGNLITASQPYAIHAYDAWNRLIKYERDGKKTTFQYDAFGRCIQITDPSGTRQLLYHGEQELGSLLNGHVHELRLVHPEPEVDRTFAIELQGQPYFPIQDFRSNICTLQKADGSLAEWTRYSAFGLKTMCGEGKFFNPWKFANRREVEGLSLFTHRFYNPCMMRWLTTDPLGFEDGLNLYSYARNNPFYYKDPDGRFVFVLPLVVGMFGAGGLAISTTALCHVGAAALVVGLAWTTGKAIHWADHKINQVDNDAHEQQREEERRQEKFKFPVNPEELLPDLYRDKDGNIITADNLRLRPEKHPMQEGEEYNPRHHGQHYHVETRRNPSKSWKKNDNIEIIKPDGYIPDNGMGTGYIPGERFPGLL